jgi:hypothetical protein
MPLWNCNLQWDHCPLTGWQVGEYGDPDGMITEGKRLKYSDKKLFSVTLSGQW